MCGIIGINSKKPVSASIINSLKNIPENEIKISAQSYLKDFYGKHGFVAKGEEYLEDGIPHTAMFISLPKK